MAKDNKVKWADTDSESSELESSSSESDEEEVQCLMANTELDLPVKSYLILAQLTLRKRILSKHYMIW